MFRAGRVVPLRQRRTDLSGSIQLVKGANGPDVLTAVFRALVVSARSGSGPAFVVAMVPDLVRSRRETNIH